MIEIIPIAKIGEDERGVTHYFNTDRTGEFILGYRKAGSVSARHYHKGISAYKNPERVILMKGEATVNWFDINGEASGSDKIIAPAMLVVYPYTWHEVIADTDFVMFELNALNDGKIDTFQLDRPADKS
ncbi:hypothetical protein [Sediminibacterium soli]|uniref:hypothetical protein n=1 Tax=Sediminibacterium soli TaxID=2698829 RepID=UPI00137B8E17|nr:hypothetical protein [Sediminibacterium soli]NCI46488.1 hypothetical protein [Sediminibacterium soli]